MEKVLEYILFICICIVIIMITLYDIQNIIVVMSIKGVPLENWQLGDRMNFYASVFTGISTMILGIVAANQNKRANEISDKLLNKELQDECCFVQLEPKMRLKIKHKDDNKIIISAHHKPDNGATIAIEKAENNQNMNEYYIKLFFKNSSKGIIKEIKINDLICVQDPSRQRGLYWDDNSNCPIPCKLDIKFSNKVQLNWFSSNNFFTHLKIYSPNNGIFSNMIENDAKTCLMFNYIITSVNNVQTKILFKIWFKKNKGKSVKIIQTNTNIEEVKIINEKMKL